MREIAWVVACSLAFTGCTLQTGFPRGKEQQRRLTTPRAGLDQEFPARTMQLQEPSPQQVFRQPVRPAQLQREPDGSPRSLEDGSAQLEKRLQQGYVWQAIGYQLDGQPTGVTKPYYRIDAAEYAFQMRRLMKVWDASWAHAIEHNDPNCAWCKPVIEASWIRKEPVRQ